ncbi:MAG: hypothetical protein KDE50_26120 [Caldilineaceae bacterium]|nr:hypothetical protein [Caldilineaceae bacterium]
MLTSNSGIGALRSLRLELEEEAGESFPQSVITELLVLRDICKKLELNIFQCQEVIGEQGWNYVNAYIDTPIGSPVDWS